MRNAVVYLKDINLADSTNARSKYIKNKSDYINKSYNNLFLKDIVLNSSHLVFGVCDCSCGNKDIVTGIHALVSGKTVSCGGCAKKQRGISKRIYDSDEYLGKVYGDLKVVNITSGLTKDGRSGVLWETECLLCGQHRTFYASELVYGTTVSCGCKGNERNTKYLDKGWVGQTINGSKIVSIKGRSSHGALWICKCQFCGNLFEVEARKVISGHTQSCGCYSGSLGCNAIEQFLIEHNISYKKEYSFDNLRSINGGKLRFDFALFSGDNLIGLVEYDGEQHWDKGHTFGHRVDIDKNFDFVIDSDNRKNDYVCRNNIALKRIKYSRDPTIILDSLSEYLYSLNLMEVC